MAFIAVMAASGRSAETIIDDAPIVIDDTFDRIPLMAPGTLYLMDDTGTLGPDDVNGTAYTQHFRIADSNHHHFGHYDGTVWVRFRLHNPLSRTVYVYLENAFPVFDEMTLYQKTSDTTWHSQSVGDHHIFSRRNVQFVNPTMKIAVAPDTTTVFLLKCRTSSFFRLPITLHGLQSFQNKQTIQSVMWGGVWGIMLIMVLYNFFLFFSIKDKSYLYYCLYITTGTVFLAGINGYGFWILWPNSTMIQHHHPPFLINLWIVAGLVFSRSFLKTHLMAPTVDRFLRLFLWITVVTMLTYPFIPMQLSVKIGIVLALFTSVFSTSVGFFIWHQGFLPARFFSIGRALFSVGVVLFALKSAGFTPDTFFTHNAITIGVVVETILMSLALGDYINALRYEKNQSIIHGSAENRKKFQALNRIRQLTAELSTVSDKARQTIEQIVHASGESVASVRQANRAITKQLSGGESIERTASSIFERSLGTQEQWERGTSMLTHTSDTLKHIHRDSEHLTHSMEVLIQKLDTINQVVSTVRNVADQSKVLSVNAAIEAQGAGEWGKGFEVIAREINELARESTTATQDADHLLQQIVGSAREITQSVQQNNQNMTGGAHSLQQVNHLVTLLSASLNESSRNAQIIADEIGQQTESLKTISDTFNTVEQAETQNMASLEKMEDVTNAINRSVAQLLDIVNSW